MALTTPAVPATGVAQLNNTGQQADVAVTGGTVQGILIQPVPLPAITQPAVPASTVAATNTNPFPVAVAVSGGTVTVIAVNGVTQYTATGNTVVVPAGGTVTLTYSVAPTWTWTALAYGVNGAPLANPTNVPLPPSTQIVLIFSAAPTWAWTDYPIDELVQGYASENLVLISQISQLPDPAHTADGQPGLGDAVSN